MKRSIALLVAILAAASTGLASAKLPAELQDRTQPIQAVIAAVQHANPAALSGLYASDAMIVDNREPFEWNGSRAGTQWLGSNQWTKWSPNVARFQAVISEAQIYGPDRTYIVLACAFSSVNAKKPWMQRGTLTFMLRKEYGRWRIVSQVWAQTPLEPSR